MPTAAKPAKAKRKAPAPRKVKRNITTNITLPITQKRGTYGERSGPKELIFDKKGNDITIKTANGERLTETKTTLTALEELVQLLKVDVRIVEGKT